MADILGNRFELGELIGAGGMGRVYRAYDSRLGREVAIKLLAAELADDDDSLRRFEREARAVAALSHSNILTLFDYDIDDSRPFLVMELLEGESLRRALEAGPLPLSRCLEIATQVCSGLAAAHHRGIVHRDLKPENVFLVAGGPTKILDFGLALLRRPPVTDASPTLTQHTAVGRVAGTPGYMAPEQARGEEVSASADVFALGALLYEMTTGRKAFNGVSAFEIAASVLRDSPSLEDIPEDLGAIVSRCLEKDPDRRFQDAEEVAAALDTIAGSPSNAAGSIRQPVAGLEATFGSRPAIAVLPFDNLSNDPDQEYLADGIVEDLILRLSRWRSFPVIARNSTFAYRRRDVDTPSIGRDLDARYIVRGSVRRAGRRVRVAVQLIDAATGHQLWGERYDRVMDDIFEIQDEISDAVVAAMHPELQRHEGQLAGRRDPASLDAWDLAHRAWWHVVRGQGTDYAVAKEIYGRALELDPELTWALYGLGMVHVNEIAAYHEESVHDSTKQLSELAERCVSADALDPLGHVLLALSRAVQRRPEEMAAEFEMAVDMDPSSVPAYRQMALHMAIAGYSERALEAADRGLRLSPKDPFLWIFFVGKACAHFSEERFEESLLFARRAVQHRHDGSIASEVLAASLAHLGRAEEGRRVLQRSLSTPEAREGMKVLTGGIESRFWKRLLEGLRLAGLDD